MKKIFITIIMSLSVLSSGLTFMPIKTYAQSSNADNFELTVAVKNPLGDKKEFKDILNSVLRAIMDIVLPVVIVMVIYSGFLYVMARGNPDAIGKAHKTLTWTLVGAAILLGAQLIATVLIDTVSNISKDAGVSSSSSSRTNNNVAVNNSNNARNVAGVNNPSGNNSNTANVANNGFSNNQNTNTNSTGGTTTGSSSGGSTGNTSSSVQTTKYYVNAPNGARLRSEPNTTSSFKTQPYGTVLNVSGETSGFYNIYNSTGTEKIGYIAKDLLTVGSVAPVQSGSSSSDILNRVIISSITPFVVSDGVSLTVNYQVEKNANISSTDKFELLCASNTKGISYVSEIMPSGQKINPGSYSVSIYLNKGFETGNQECYIRYVDGITKSIKWSNKITTKFIGVKASDYFKLNKFFAVSGKPLEVNLNFTSLANFTTDSAPVVKCMKDNVFINLSDTQLSYKVFDKNKDYSKLLKFTYYGVYYCTIQFDYLGSEFMTDLLGVTIK